MRVSPVSGRVWTSRERAERIKRIERELRVGVGPYTVDLRWAMRQIKELDKQLRSEATPTESSSGSPQEKQEDTE